MYVIVLSCATDSIIWLYKAAIKMYPKPSNEQVSLQYNNLLLLLHNNCIPPVQIILVRKFRCTNFHKMWTLLCNVPLPLLNGLCVIIHGITMVKVFFTKKKITCFHFFGLWIRKKQIWNSEPFVCVCKKKRGGFT